MKTKDEKRKFISLTNTNRIGNKGLYSNHVFFSKPFVCEIKQFHIEFRRPLLNNCKKIYKVRLANRCVGKWVSSIGDKGELKSGRYFIDEKDSSEDCLIVDLI